jgi:hypothetical protein
MVSYYYYLTCDYVENVSSPASLKIEKQSSISSNKAKPKKSFFANPPKKMPQQLSSEDTSQINPRIDSIIQDANVLGMYFKYLF